MNQRTSTGPAGELRDPADAWIQARDCTFDQGPPSAIADEHRELRHHAAAIHAAASDLALDRRDAARQRRLHELVREFASRLYRHFATEESACARSSVTSPARKWFESLARDHLDFRRRFEAVGAALERAIGDGTPVAETLRTEIDTLMDDLAHHELTEARLFQISVLGH